MFFIVRKYLYSSKFEIFLSTMTVTHKDLHALDMFTSIGLNRIVKVFTWWGTVVASQEYFREDWKSRMNVESTYCHFMILFSRLWYKRSINSQKTVSPVMSKLRVSHECRKWIEREYSGGEKYCSLGKKKWQKNKNLLIRSFTFCLLHKC